MPRSLLTLCLCLGTSSCFFVAEGDAARADFSGSLVVDWTIDGATDPYECDQSDASWLRLSVFTSSGHHVGDFVDACHLFATSVELAPGSYYADAELEDANGNARTTPAAIEDFTIIGNDTSSIPIEFPSSSFF